MTSSTPAAAWAELEPSDESSPSSRYSATVTVVIDPILIGGTDGRRSFADAWRLHCGPSSCRWERLRDPPSDFEARHSHSAVGVETRSGVVEIWILGGLCKKHPRGFSSAWTFSPSDGSWARKEVKDGERWLRRRGHTSMLSPKDPKKIWIFGGFQPANMDFSNDFFELDTSELTIKPILTATSTVPITPRACCTMTMDEKHNVLFFGGLSRPGKAWKSFAIFNADKKEWKEFRPQRGILCHHAAIQNGRRLVIFGGAYMKGDLQLAPNLLMEMDLYKSFEVNRIEKVRPVPGRIQHCFFQMGEFIYMIGGRQTLGSTKSFQLPTEMKVLRLDLNQTLQGTGMACSEIEGRTGDGNSNTMKKLAEEELKKDEKIMKLQVCLTKARDKLGKLTKKTIQDEANDETNSPQDALLEFPSQDEVIARLSAELAAVQQAKQSATRKALIFGV